MAGLGQIELAFGETHTLLSEPRCRTQKGGNPCCFGQESQESFWFPDFGAENK